MWLELEIVKSLTALRAGLAQLVVHLICNQGVGGSNPSAGTISLNGLQAERGSPPPVFLKPFLIFIATEPVERGRECVGRYVPGRQGSRDRAIVCPRHRFVLLRVLHEK